MDLSAPDIARLLEQREWLRTLARALVGADEAEDLAQEAWLAALRHPHALSEPRAWLAGIARNLARGLRRSRGRRAARELLAARAEALPSTDELVERLDTEQRLARELADLREPFRTTLLLRFHEGLAAQEIARRQGVPAGTVRWRTKTGLAELRARLERAFGGREALGLALLPLARAGGLPGASVAAAVGGGGLIMGTLGKGFAGAAALALVALLAARNGPAPLLGGEDVLPRATIPSPRAPASAAARAPEVARDAAPALPLSTGERDALGGVETATRLRILESDGRPHAGRRVHWRPRGGGPASEARTDEHGWLALEADGTRVELAIERVGALPERCELPLEPGERELRLPEGLELSGHVVVQDGASPAGIALTLVPGGGDGTSPEPLDPFSTPRARLGTEADGSFRFHALAAGSYDLAFPPGYRRAGAESDPYARLVLRDLRPARGLVLEVERLPRLSGRLVEADGHRPTAGVVECVFTSANGTHTSSGARAGEDGRFELVPGGPWRALALEYWGLPGVRGRTKATFQERELARDWDLGDLRLAAGRALTLRVRDPAGRAVAGARTDLDAPPTDARGETRLTDVTAAALRVGARGFHEQRVDLTAGLATVEVTLEPAPELTLELRDRGGKPVGGLLVELRARRWLFEGETPGMLLCATREGRLLTWDAEPFAARYAASDAGLVRIDALLAGLPFELRVLASGGALVHEGLEPPLGPDERRVLPLELAGERIEIHGRVLAEDGTPVRGARLTLPEIRGAGFAHALLRRTDGDGRFRWETLLVPGLRLGVRHPGYLPQVRPIPRAPEEELEFVLERGASVGVRVLDELGRPQAGGSLRVPDSSPVESPVQATGPGVFEVSGLSAGNHTFVLSLGGRSFVRAHPAHEPELVFRVPVMGALEASWELPASVAGARFVQLEVHERVEGRLALEQGFHDTPAGTWRFDPFAPGEYQVLLTCAEGETVRVLAGARVTVVAGQTAAVHLDPIR